MPRKNKNIALHAAGCICVYLFKKGRISTRCSLMSGVFPTPEIAKVIEREALQRERQRLAHRFRKAAKRNEDIADATGTEYAKGSAFAFNHAARIALGKTK
jgi:hypothetical protein